MFYQAFSLGLAIMALLLVLVTLRALLRRDWFLVWLRASTAMAVVVLAVVIALVAADLYSYQAVTQETKVATVSMAQIGDQHFQVNVSVPDGAVRHFELHGDLWQLDARVITLQGPLAALGLQPGYRLDRLSGRYLLLEQERSAERSVFEVRHGDSALAQWNLDLWRWLQDNPWLPWVDANYGASTYMPMKDGAEYLVSLSHKGMLARPLNSQAVDAVQVW